jgi:hypothetical protein
MSASSATTYPLLTAIATGNPTGRVLQRALDPANLDRFTIQMRTLGLLQRNQWEQAAKVIDLYATTTEWAALSRKSIGPSSMQPMPPCHKSI